MATSNLGIVYVAASQADKEGTINTGFDKLDGSVAGRLVHDYASDADYTLTTNENLNMILDIQDSGVALTTTRNIILASNTQMHIAVNNTAQIIQFKLSTGTGASIQPGAMDIVYSDGTNVEAIAGISDSGHPYELTYYFPGKPGAAGLMAKTIMTQTIELASGLSGSYCTSEVASTAAKSLDIKKNGSSVGTVDFAAAATSATFTFSTGTTFNAGDDIKIEGPAIQDTTLADISLSIKGLRFI